MITFFQKIAVSAVAVTASFAFSASAVAQAVKVTAEKPSFDDLPSPTDFGGAKSKSFKPKDWLEVETKLKFQMAPAPKSQTLERMTVKWYIAVKNPEKSGTFLLLTKDIEYVNIALDEDVFSSVYLAPASLKRLTGSDRAGKGSVEYVGFEVLVNGEKLAADTNKGQVGWWNAASDKISRTDTVPLLSKKETPFGVMWWDRYAEEAPVRR
jgi:hypothetical protein